MNIINNYNKIKKHIQELNISLGRDINSVKIISVSKTFPIATVQEAIDSGIQVFGENKIQEAKLKHESLTGKFSFHLIGHLQSNKAKEAVKIFDLIHSIDKLSTAEKLNKEAAKINKIQEILIQVNATNEESKNGIHPSELNSIFESINDLSNIKVMGIMGIGPTNGTEKKIRKAFKMCKQLLDNLNKKYNINLKELSMGMSSDYEIAIEEGATFIRVGRAIFGKRDYI